MLDVIDVTKEQFQEVEIREHYGIFTELRIDKSTIPEGMNCYELRHGDDDSYPAALEQGVRVNYFGAVLMMDKMELGENGVMELSYDDFGFTGEDLSVTEYLLNYGEKEPEAFSVESLVRFSKEDEKTPELTAEEADVLLGYMEGHEYILGEYEGQVYRGDLCYADGVIRWLSYPLDDAIRTVYEWNDEFLEEAEEKVENAGNYDEFVKASEYLKELKAQEKLLDAMFDRTRYGKHLTEVAEKIAGEIISDWEKTGRVDEAVKKMIESVDKEVEVLQEQEERTERSR